MGYSPWNHKESDVSEHKARDMTFINMKGNLDLVSQASDISFHYSLNFNHSDLSIFQNHVFYFQQCWVFITAQAFL